MENATMSDRWLSGEDIAAYLGVSKDTIYAWVAKMNMFAHRVGRLRKFQKSEVDLWVKAGGANENKSVIEE
ncbi:MAG: helix-turn-helix domain-containing protein [Burkholderiaceae bacterium]